MDQRYPSTFDEAVAHCLQLLSESAKQELKTAGYIDPHRKYETDFVRFVNNALGISSGQNAPLLTNIYEVCEKDLLFYEVCGTSATSRGAVRLILREMVNRV